MDLAEVARGIVDTSLYMVLGTAGPDGHPWVSPVYFSSEEYTSFYWISSPDARHSHNIAGRAEVAITVFDSQVPPNTGQAVYMAAVAEQLIDGEAFEHGVDVFNGRFPDPAAHGLRMIAPGDLVVPAPYRLYRAVASGHWVLDPDASPDARTPVRI